LTRGRALAEMLPMVEQDTHIVARLAGIPKAGCRGVDYAA
jgi:hypothetical protein